MLRMLLPLLTRLLLELLPLMTMARPQLPRPSRHQVSRTETPSFLFYRCILERNRPRLLALSPPPLTAPLGIILCGECKGVGKVTQEYAARAS